MHAALVSPAYADPERRGKLRALAGMGCTVSAIIPGGTSGADGPVRLVGVPARGVPERPETLRWSARRVLHALRDHRPDLVQVEAEPHTALAAAAAAAARRLRVPWVSFSWESLAHERPWLARRRRRAVLEGAAGVIGGNALAAGLQRAAAPGARHAVIPQFGVAVPPASARPDRPGLAIGCVGRLRPERGVDELLQALNHVHGAWTLEVLGTGPEQEALEAMAQRFGQASRIRWLGGAGRDAVEALWHAIDVLVVPSRATPAWVEQHHPLLLEAMARGVAAVVSDTGALPDLVGDAGIVTDSVEGLGLALQTLLADPARRAALGAAGRQRVLARYTDAAVAAQTLEFWRIIAGADAPDSPSLTGAAV